jgi:hypothetical protein
MTYEEWKIVSMNESLFMALVSELISERDGREWVYLNSFVYEWDSTGYAGGAEPINELQKKDFRCFVSKTKLKEIEDLLKQNYIKSAKYLGYGYPTYRKLPDVGFNAALNKVEQYKREGTLITQRVPFAKGAWSMHRGKFTNKFEELLIPVYEKYNCKDEVEKKIKDKIYYRSKVLKKEK